MHWLAKAIEILQADTLDLRTPAILAGGDPTVFYRGADLTNADLRGQDLRDMSFQGATLEGVLIDSETLMNRELIAQLYRRERRVALVFGNAAYESVNPLKKTVKDAADVADALERLGFDVFERYNLGVEEMRGVLKDFEDKVSGADWALVYYAGHAMELGGENWLIPVDAELTRSTDLLDQAIPMESVAEILSGATRLRIMMLDAAPLAAIAHAHGEIVFCAARPGTEAYEGPEESRNSFFTEALLTHMEEEGLELGQFFRKVTSHVIEATKDHRERWKPQEPCVYGSIPDEELYFNPPLDYKALLRLVTMKLRGISRDEVEAELKRAEAELKFGKPMGVAEIPTVVGLLVQLARVAVLISTNTTTEQLVAALEARAASADKIDKEKRDEIIKLIVDQLDRLK